MGRRHSPRAQAFFDSLQPKIAPFFHTVYNTKL
jgi:hypothetical protein